MGVSSFVFAADAVLSARPLDHREVWRSPADINSRAIVPYLPGRGTLRHWLEGCAAPTWNRIVGPFGDVHAARAVDRHPIGVAEAGERQLGLGSGPGRPGRPGSRPGRNRTCDLGIIKLLARMDPESSHKSLGGKGFGLPS
jgi:hypothetical protein